MNKHQSSPRNTQRGFSLIEALVVLTVTSLILAAILPISIRSIASNLRISERGLSDIAGAIDEAAFRALLGSAVPARQTVSSQPGRTSLTGDASRIDLISLSRLGGSCTSANRETRVSLVIERDGRGGRLVCTGPEASRVLARWTAGDAAFSYSRDGTAWVSNWPTAEDQNAWERSLMQSAEFNSSSTTPLVWAPLVRFEVTSAGPDRLIWIERGGEVAPVEFDPEAIFTGELFGGGL